MRCSSEWALWAGSCPREQREMRMEKGEKEGCLWVGVPSRSPAGPPTTKAHQEITLLPWNIKKNSLTRIQT